MRYPIHNLCVSATETTINLNNSSKLSALIISVMYDGYFPGVVEFPRRRLRIHTIYSISYFYEERGWFHTFFAVFFVIVEFDHKMIVCAGGEYFIVRMHWNCINRFDIFTRRLIYNSIER